MNSTEKATRRIPPSSSSSSLAALSLESTLRSKLSFFAILASLFLFLLLHQSLLPNAPSSPPSSSSPSSFPRRSANHASFTAPGLHLNTTSPQHHNHSSLSTGLDLNTTSHQHGNHSSLISPGLDVNKTNQQHHDEEEIRVFHPYGSAAALYVLYSAYRGGSNTFAAVGLGSKPLFVYGKPEFECYWLPSTAPPNSSTTDPHTHQPAIKSKIAYSMLPDWGFGRVYTVVIVNCTFEEAVGTASQQRGGQLVLYASYGDGLGKPPERIVALEEDQHSYNASLYEPPYPYDYLYCGSPLFSNLNPQRIREWIAYHVMLFGPKSHFIFHDAGGMHEGVRAVLEPWKKQGFITIQNVKQTTQYDGYYYNQFLINNDCLHRTKFMANWTFFFDVDEYIYTPPDVTLRSVLDWHANDTSLNFKQLRMSESLCQFEEPENDTRWAFEKLVYGEEFRDLKYAVQARRVYATGVHYSQKELGHMEGEMGWAWWPHMHFYHYHNTISKHGKLCENITHNSTTFTLNRRTYKLDTSMVSLAPLVQEFERTHIGTS